MLKLHHIEVDRVAQVIPIRADDHLGHGELVQAPDDGHDAVEEHHRTQHGQRHTEGLGDQARAVDLGRFVERRGDVRKAREVVIWLPDNTRRPAVFFWRITKCKRQSEFA